MSTTLAQLYLPPIHTSAGPFVSLDEIIEIQFSEEIQAGNDTITVVKQNLDHFAEQSAANQVQTEIFGAIVRIHMRSNAFLEFATKYSLVFRPYAVMNLAGRGNQLHVQEVQTEGPFAGSWRCSLGNMCSVSVQLAGVSQGLNASGTQIIAVRPGFCRAHMFNHPGSSSVFPDWATADSNEDSEEATTATYELGVALTGAGVYDLCWRSRPDALFAARFGSLTLAGTNNCTAACLQGRNCNLTISGFELSGLVSLHSGEHCDAEQLSDFSLESEVNETSINIPAGLPLFAGKDYTVCWAPESESARVSCGSLLVSGPTSITGPKAEKLAPSAFQPFQLHISGSGLALTDDIAVGGPNCTQNFAEGDSEDVDTDPVRDFNSSISSGVFGIPLTGWTGSYQSSLRWTVSGLVTGHYTVCWKCLGCTIAVLVGEFEVPAESCGNGVREGSEGCDDGNVEAEDGCDASCEPEAGFDCKVQQDLPDLCRAVVNIMLTSRLSMTGDEVQPVVNLVSASSLPWLVSSTQASVLIDFDGEYELRMVRLEVLFPTAPETDLHVEIGLSESSRTTWDTFATLSLVQSDSQNSSRIQQDPSSLCWARWDRTSSRHLLLSKSQATPCRSMRISMRLAGVLVKTSKTWTTYKLNWKCEGVTFRDTTSQTAVACQESCNEFQFAAFRSVARAVSCRCFATCHAGSVVTGYVVYQSAAETSESGPVAPWGMRDLALIGVAQEVNCSQAHDCAALHREPCEDGKDDHRCGDCLVDWEGEKGPSESPCVRHQIRECLADDWSDWSPCSRTCGIGWVTRARSIIDFPDEGADDCPALEEKQRCNLAKCDDKAPFCSNSGNVSLAGDVLTRRLSRKTQSMDFSDRRLQAVTPGIEDLATEIEGLATLAKPSTQMAQEMECELSEGGTEHLEKIADITAGKPSAGCPIGFFVRQVHTRCVDADQCVESALEPGCYLVHCCEPCAKDCKECMGPLAQDCLVCGSDKLTFVHNSGRRQCIKADTCVKMGCFRPTADGTCERDLKRWDCDDDVNDDDDGDPVSQKIERAEPDGETCAHILPEPTVRACSDEPSDDCSSNLKKLCFYDTSCDEGPQASRHGCNAGGFPNCRWCGFGDYDPCPGSVSFRRLAETTRSSVGPRIQRVAMKFQAAKTIDFTLKGFGATKLVQLASPYVDSFFKDKIVNPLISTLQTSLSMAVNQTFQAIVRNIMDKSHRIAVEPINLSLPESSVLSTQLQDMLKERFDDRFEHSGVDSVLASLLPPIPELVGESQEVSMVKLVYDQVQKRSMPLISQSVNQGIRSALKEIGEAASTSMQSQIDNLRSDAQASLEFGANVAVLRAVSSAVTEDGRTVLAEELLKTLQVDVLAAVNDEVLHLNLSVPIRGAVNLAMRSLLPMVFDLSERRLQQVVGYCVHKIEQHSAALVQSTLASVLGNRAENFDVSTTTPVQNLVRTASHTLEGVLMSAAASFGKTFGVDSTDKLVEIFDPLLLQLRKSIGHLLASTVSTLVSSFVQELGGAVAGIVDSVTHVISSEVTALVDDVTRSIAADATKLLGTDTGAFQSMAKAVKAALKRLPKQIKKRRLLVKVWDSAKAEMERAVAKLLAVAQGTITQMQSAKPLRDFRNSLSAAGQEAALKFMAFVSSKAVATILSPDLILYPLERTLDAKVVSDALQAVSTRMEEHASVDVQPSVAQSGVQLGALELLERRKSVIQAVLLNISDPKALAHQFRACVDNRKDNMQEEVAEILLQITSAFAFRQFEQELAVKQEIQKAASKAQALDVPRALMSMLVVINESLGHCVDRVMSTELVQYSLQTAAAARLLVEEAVVVEPLLHFSFRREEVSGNGAYTTGSLEVWNKSANERLMSVKFLEVGPASRIPAGDYVASLQPWERECGTALFLEQVPDRLDARVTCGDVADAASSATILLAEHFTESTITKSTRTSNSHHTLADLVQLAKRHVGQLLVSIQDEVSDGPTWEQKVEEKFVRLAVGANAPIGAAPSEKTHAAQGWAFYLDVCGQKHCAYVSINGNLCAIAFGGSAAVTNWAAGRGSFSDMEAELLGSGRSGQRLSSFQAEDSRVYQVHSRVLEAYEDIKQSPNWRQWLEMFDTRCGEVHMIGHGFGGAIAMLHRLDRDFKQVFVRTFGAPRLFGAISEATCERSWRFWLQDSNCADPIPAMPSSLVHDWSMSSPLSLDKSNEQIVSTPECGQHPEILMQTSTKCRSLHLAENYLHAWRKSESECDLQAGSLV